MSSLCIFEMLKAYNNCVFAFCLAACSCGLFLATGSSAGGVRLWDLLDLRARAAQQVS